MLTTPKGRRIKVGAKLGEGGQGAVFAIEGTSKVVLKLYYAQQLVDDPTLESRLRLMVVQRPDKAEDPKTHRVMLTWPSEIVLDNNSFAGFLMPMIDQSHAIALHRLTNPTDARRETTGPTAWAHGFTWKYLVAAASNLATAVDALHKVKAVVADFNDANVLVWKDATVTLIDCDSMQITDPNTGLHYLCKVGRPEFTPPELLNADWQTTVRAQSSDLFALAVHVHQLILEGEHPFRGVWHGTGDVPPAEMLARRGLWAYGGDRLLSPRPFAVGLELLPDDVTALFRRAFIDGATNPRRRPSAMEWRAALTTLEANLAICHINRQHFYRKGLAHCPWCAHEAKRKKAGGRKTPTVHPPPAQAAMVPHLRPLTRPTVPPGVVTPPIPQYQPTPLRSPPKVRRRHSRRWLILALVLVGITIFVFSNNLGHHGAESPITSDPSYPLDAPSVAIAVAPGGRGYWLVTNDGQVEAFGGVTSYGQVSGPYTPIVNIVSTIDGDGYWILDSGGGVYAFGDARSYGGVSSSASEAPAVGLAPTADGRGYWIVARNGGVFAFGDAPFLGSAVPVNPGPIAGIAADWATGGYWLAGEDGGVYAFHAPFYGSAEPFHDTNPVLGIQTDDAGGGYRLVTSNGGVFAFGLPFHGSMSDKSLDDSAVDITGDGSANHYWIAGADGGVFTFGGAGFAGSAAS